MNLTQKRYQEAKKIIPNGTQLLSKKPELYAPDYWPGYFTKAKGCAAWDLDGKKYYDFSNNSVGACLLGYAYDPVVEAVTKRIVDGSMCSQNPAEEVELAEKLCAIHPWAEQVRFARSGGEIASVAVRIARATTGRDVIAVCGYHGWTDFYIAVNLGETEEQKGKLLDNMPPDGVPSGLRCTTVAFNYGNLAEFDAIIDKYGDRLAGVVMETARSSDPEPGFMEHIRAETKRVGALMILDEISIGWRNGLGGYHRKLGVVPDMAIFAKAMGNGHPISAVIGTKAAMEGAAKAFISSTFWTEAVGPAAALVTIAEMERTKVWEKVWDTGTKVMDLWHTMGQKHGLPVAKEECYPALAHFSFSEQGMQLKTLFTRMMLEHGFLANTGFYPTLAHTPEIVDAYGTALDQVFEEMAEIRKRGDVEKVLQESTCISGFSRLVK